MDPSNQFRLVIRSLESSYKLLWNILTLSLFVMLYSVYSASSVWDPEHPLPPASPAYYILAIVFLGIFCWLQGSLFSNRKFKEELNAKADIKELARNKQTGKVDTDLLIKIRNLDDVELKTFTFFSRSFNRFVISLVLSNLIALCGLLKAYAEQNTYTVLPFILLSLVINFIIFPRVFKLYNRVFKVMNA
ncbi:MAG: hypothetical protein D6808_01250 [Candidatus Dadabacteria bacterium]|nr:MAG: hypothetical protein D6808_01250 [Candidatus Dadabacteria bacterium]